MSIDHTMRTRLRATGLTARAIDAAWPAWWSDEAESSASAVAELKFSLARQLGLSPSSLMGDGDPTFLWSDETRFKNLGSVTSYEAAVLASFSISIARSALLATPHDAQIPLPSSALDLRSALLTQAGSIGLRELVGTCWGLGIPVVQLEVFPLQQKRMHAVSARVGERHAVLVGHQSSFPAQAAFWIAHELGHIALGHVHDSAALMDVDDPLTTKDKDDEELAADRYALELLTGTSEPRMESVGSYTASQLAASVRRAEPAYQVDAGVLALCLGHAEGRWEQVFGALKILGEVAVGGALNDLALRTMDLSILSDDARAFLETVLGTLDDA